MTPDSLPDRSNVEALGETLRRRKVAVILESAELPLPRITGLDLTPPATDEEEA